MRTIRGAKPQSIAELARLTKRAETNLPRTIGKLEAFGLLEIRTINRCRVPFVKAAALRVGIDLYAMRDRIEVRGANSFYHGVSAEDH